MTEDAARAEMPGFEAWLSASWADFRRRWWTTMAAGGLAGAASLVGGALALLLAPLLQLSGALAAPAAWALGGALSLLTLTVLSAWAQAAVILAITGEDGPMECLARARAMTLPLAWTLSLMAVLVGGGLAFLLLPGLAAFALLSLAPVIEARAEASGWGALERSAARIAADPGVALPRLAAAVALCALPSWIPYLGWILGPLLAPFWFSATARLDADLRAARPDPAPVPGLRVVGILFALAFVALCAAAAWGAVLAWRAFGAGVAAGLAS
jgi:hypothetical protein